MSKVYPGRKPHKSTATRETRTKPHTDCWVPVSTAGCGRVGHRPNPDGNVRGLSAYPGITVIKGKG